MFRIPPSASTRFQPPLPVARWLSRPRMDSVFTQVNDRRFTLIHAPAGFGKSTLAAQWLDALRDQGVRTAWLSLDADDDRPLWFLSHLLECFRRIHPSIDDSAARILEERPEDAEIYLLPLLVNAVHSVTERTVVVLDDWHVVLNPRTRAVLARLIEDSGDKLGMIVTSRTTAGLPLAKLRVQDQLVEVDPQFIRFDTQESHQFLVDIKGIKLTDTQLVELHGKTEGWVAALQLASLSLRKHADVPALLTELGSRQHGIGEYLTENVLDLIDPRLREFLLRTSVLTRMNVELARLLSEQPDAGDLLVDALSGDLFVQRLGETGGWYRYHHLFRDFLLEHLTLESPELVAGLHAKAAKWYRDNGMLVQAVDHAMQAGEHMFAIEAVEAEAIRLVEHSRMSTLLALVEKLPADEIQSRAGLQLAIAWAYCLLHFSREADQSLTLLDAAVQHDPSLSGAGRFRLQREALVVRECLEMYQDKVTPDDRLQRDVLDEAERLDPWTVSVAANVLTFFEINRNRGAEAQEIQRWAEQYHRNVVGSFSEVYGSCFAGLISFHDLDMPQVKHHWEHAFEVGTKRSGRQSHAARLALGLIGKLHYHLGDLDAAEGMFEETLLIGHRAGVVDFMFPVYESLAFIRMQRGDRKGALAVIEAGERAGHELSLVRLWARMATTRAKLGLEAPPPRAPAGASERELEFLRDELVRFDLALAMHSFSCEESADLVHRAEQLLIRNRTQGNRFQALRDQIMLVGALEMMGAGEQAEELLAKVLPVCEVSGMVQVLREGGEQVRQVAQRIAPARLVSALWMSEVWPVDRIESGHAGATAPVLTLPTPDPAKFTLREREILKLIDAGHTNREIADELFLGVNTIKWYLQKLYRSFGVSDRDECVQRAKTLEVITG
ncbi:MAG: LuxR C-terminal-related transcriptional regulator [Leucobacter sp.]